MVDALSAATVAIYAALLLVVLYLFVRHGREGLLGWLYLAIFCILRIIGGGMGINKPSTSASIISSVGLSPLLLATSGILHEGRVYRIHKLNQKIEWVLVLFFHILVVVGIALTAAGSVKLTKDTDPTSNNLKVVEAGISILVVCWGILVGWAGSSFIPIQRSRSRPGTVLLVSVAFGLLFIGVRVFYTLVALVTQAEELDMVNGAIAIRVVLGFLMELIAALAYVVAGFMTQGKGLLIRRKPEPEVPRSEVREPVEYA